MLKFYNNKLTTVGFQKSIVLGSHRSIPATNTDRMNMDKQPSKLDHLARTSTEPREKNLIWVKIVGVDTVNEKTRLLKLGLQEGPAKFLAGQWLDTFVPGNPKPGGFTIASAPSTAARATEPYFELAVQEAPENPVAAWLWKPENEILHRFIQVRVGGSFVCPPTEGLDGIRRIILVAGGVGINPLVSMLGYVADQDDNLSIQLSVMYSTREPEDGDLGEVLFLDRILNLFRTGRVSGNVKLFLTRPASHIYDRTADETGGIDVRFGRIEGGDLLSEISSGGSKESTLVYICGPPAMTDSFVDLLTAPDVATVISAARVKSEKWW
ncbi:Riboflavin synthase-like beta-barrel [Cordyceps militaris CM01]|uniref:Riboflavin synthase-like beta-barrel n=1 Tax=Cordyceps militaris (strain CM01) TaxID=983644 RepID=G3JDB8_CORMM|nr:Riboflavin synthase-like beta-barrel [Cordyceps militaris CM01]EGX92593.1 Riboflavin synthase-like beta-barrel [Cordyceps militaris CM01]